MNLRKTAALISACGLLLCSCGEKEEKEIRVYTGLFGSKGNPISSDNEIRNLIAEKTGAMCLEEWVYEKSNSETAFSDMIAADKYTDFIYTDVSIYQRMIKNNALIPIDNYWDDYPNIKAYLTDKEWNRVRAEDGHVYFMPLFSTVHVRDSSTYHNDEAFWIQLRVLEWAGYPKLETLDDYFDLIEKYLAANPTNERGEKYIGYEILANSNQFFSLDNPPMFLDGYPNDGCCIVDTETHEAKDYNLSPTAEKWFKKLNEEYHKGVIDPECFVLSTQQYFDKLSTGNVLGIVDQKWNFNDAITDLPPECTYIPFGITIEEGIEEHYHSRVAFNSSSGFGITKSCTDIEGALQFVNDLLSPEILNLRFWGIEGVDYTKDENGIFSQDKEQMKRWRDSEYAEKHICLYNFFPYPFGMAPDGINAYCPSNQAQMYYDTLKPEVQKCFDAYGVHTYLELLNDAPENSPWFPMWSYTPEEGTAAREALDGMNELKLRSLPQIVMGDDFDKLWKQYEHDYSTLNTEAYFDSLTQEVQRRIDIDENGS